MASFSIGKVVREQLISIFSFFVASIIALILSSISTVKSLFTIAIVSPVATFKPSNIAFLRPLELCLKRFILKDFELSNNNSLSKNNYDSEISVSGINYNFVNEINRLRPFGNANQLPIFLIKNLKIIKSTIIKERHINLILKPKTGQSINSICFNSFNTPLGDFLISYKKEVNVIVQIQENIWNNKKSLQLNIKDVLIDLN